MKDRIEVKNSQGKVTEKIDLNSDNIYGKVNFSLLKQAILMYQSNRRQGTASTKNRAEVRGGGRKPWAQKGTGRARAGSIRSPIWRGGGITFGPKPRDYSYSIPKKMKRKALGESLKVKLKDKEIYLIEELVCNTPKTKDVLDVLKNLNLLDKKSILFITETIDKNLILSCRNISNFNIINVSNINSYDVLKNSYLLMTKSAFNKLAKDFNFI